MWKERVCFALLVLAAGVVSSAQDLRFPRGMYCGGNQLVYVGLLRSARMIVTDPSGAAIPRARIQAQIQGAEKILFDIKTDAKGRFRSPRLPKGSYWLGISSRGFNLHYWEWKVVDRPRTVTLQVELSLGT